MNAQSYRRYIEIWERHREEIWRFIQSRLRNSSEQEDILQEVFLALYQKLDSGEEIQNARAWLYKTAHNQCCSKIHDLQSVRERMVSMDDDLWRSQEPCDEGRTRRSQASVRNRCTAGGTTCWNGWKRMNGRFWRIPMYAVCRYRISCGNGTSRPLPFIRDREGFV